MRRTQITCPATGERTVVTQGKFDGMPEILTDENDRVFVPDALPAEWGALALGVRIANPEFPRVQALRLQAQRGAEEQLRQMVEEAKQGGAAAPGEAELQTARQAMLDEIDQQYPVPEETVCVVYTVQDLAPRAVLQLAGVLASMNLALVAPAQALTGGFVPPTQAAPAPAPAAPAPAAPAASVQAAPEQQAPQAPRTPATGAILPESAPAAGAQAPTPPNRTPATGAIIPEVVHPAPDQQGQT